jgi:secondary thiamine-phosphate synthase enzyme
MVLGWLSLYTQALAPNARSTVAPGLRVGFALLMHYGRHRLPAATTVMSSHWRDGNGHSHLAATLLGPSLTVAISEGKLVLGTWQQIFHLECDARGRERTIVVTVTGDLRQSIRN